MMKMMVCRAFESLAAVTEEKGREQSVVVGGLS